MNSSPSIIDCRGMVCPAPVLRVAEAARARPTDPFTVLATDPDFAVDIEAWCRAARARLLSVETLDDGSLRARVALAEAGGPPAAPKSEARAPLTPSPSRGATLDLVGLEPRAAMQLVQKAFVESELVSLVADMSLEARIYGWAGASDASIVSIERNAGRLSVVLSNVTLAREVDVPREPPLPRLRSLQDSGDFGSETRAEPRAALDPPRENQATLLVLKNDYESLLSALMVANASAAQGMKVKMFFAFWGINMLRAASPRKGTKRKAGFFQRVLKMMMPRGMRDQRLGQLHMGGMGKRILLWLMRKRNVMNVEQLVEQAVKQKVEFIVCSMSMGIMGIDEGEIEPLPNLRYAGVASFAAESRQSCTALVF